jgi:hypothetical protein
MGVCGSKVDPEAEKNSKAIDEKLLQEQAQLEKTPTIKILMLGMSCSVNYVPRSFNRSKLFLLSLVDGLKELGNVESQP